MNKELIVTTSTENKEGTVYTPFVNEECGDTMRDEVLKAIEETDKEQLNKLSKLF